MLFEPTGCEPFDDSICEIPLCGRDGNVRARARVDPDDWFALARYSWRLGSHGYACGGMGHDVTILLHRHLIGLEAGDRRWVDHINRDKLDNRRANLRIVTGAQNAQNRDPRPGSSVYRGVSWDIRNRRWVAQVGLAGRNHVLGHFHDEESAAAAAAAFRAEHMPFSQEGMAAQGAQ